MLGGGRASDLGRGDGWVEAGEGDFVWMCGEVQILLL